MAKVMQASIDYAEDAVRRCKTEQKSCSPENRPGWKRLQTAWEVHLKEVKNWK